MRRAQLDAKIACRFLPVIVSRIDFVAAALSGVAPRWIAWPTLPATSERIYNENIDCDHYLCETEKIWSVVLVGSLVIV